MKSEPSSSAAERLIRILAFTMTLSSMGATMFNLVLSDISREFDLTFAQVSWISSAYFLIYAVGSVIYGKLADSYKLKDLITFGLGLFVAGSIVGLVAHAYGTVLLGLIMQAAGAAVVPATAMIIPTRYFPPETRGRAIGITATGLAVGSAVGPVVSALILSALHWRWLFAVPLLIIVTLPFYRKYLKEEQPRGGSIDWLGGGLLGGSVSLLLLAVTYEAWMLAGGALALFLLFIWRIRSVNEPFVEPRLFSNRHYTVCLGLSALIMGVNFSLPFLTPQLLAEVNRLEPAWIGFAMVPGAAVTAMLGSKGGRLADTRGVNYLFYMAFMLLLIAFLLLSSLAGSPPVIIALVLILGYVGQMFMQVSLSKTISLTLPPKHTGIGMGLWTLSNFLSGAVSTALYGKALDLGKDTYWNPLHLYQGSSAFSNIYTILAMLQIVIFAVFYLQFAKRRRKMSATL